jgi:prevent-host-death family protein
MRTASVSELKANLSRYLRLIRSGSEVTILERGAPIARLVGLKGNSRGSDRARLDRLVRAGVLRGGSDLRWVLAEPPVKAKRARLSRALDQDREDRF